MCQPQNIFIIPAALRPVDPSQEFQVPVVGVSLVSFAVEYFKSYKVVVVVVVVVEREEKVEAEAEEEEEEEEEEERVEIK